MTNYVASRSDAGSNLTFLVSVRLLNEPFLTLEEVCLRLSMVSSEGRTILPLGWKYPNSHMIGDATRDLLAVSVNSVSKGVPFLGDMVKSTIPVKEREK